MTINPDDPLPQYLLKMKKYLLKNPAMCQWQDFSIKLNHKLKPCTKASSYLGDTMSSGVTLHQTALLSSAQVQPPLVLRFCFLYKQFWQF